MELYRRLGVKVVTQSGLRGSGCIFQTKEKTYVFTAFHCISEDKTSRSVDFSSISLFDFEDSELEIQDIYFPPESDLDFAIIEVKALKNYDSVNINYPFENMKIKLFGYPEYLSGDEDEGESLDGYVSEVRDDYNLTLQHESLDSLVRDSHDSTKGFSGSAIYSLHEGKYTLIGIIRSLRGEGEHGKIRGINIMAIDNFCKSVGLADLIPQELSNFDKYLNLILAEEHKRYQPILENAYTRYIDNLSPYSLFKELNKKLIIPYDERLDILEDEIWKGWVRLLLYITIHRKESINILNIKDHISLFKKSKSKNNFYYSQSVRVEELLKNLYEDAYDDISDCGVVIINSSVLRHRKILNKEILNGIVVSIDQIHESAYKRGIDITNPAESKSFIVVPISYIIDKIEEEIMSICSSNVGLRVIENRISELITEIFDEFLLLSNKEVKI